MMTRRQAVLAYTLLGAGLLMAGFPAPSSAQTGIKIIRSQLNSPFYLERATAGLPAKTYYFLNPVFHSSMFLQLQVVPSGATTTFTVTVTTRDASSAPGAGNGTIATFCSLQSIGPSGTKSEGSVGSTGLVMAGDAANKNMMVCPDLIGPFIEVTIGNGAGLGTATTYDIVAVIVPASSGIERTVRGPYTVGQTIDTGSGLQGSPVMAGAVDASNIVRYQKVDANGNVLVNCGTGANACQVQGTAAAAAPPVGNPVQMGGTDGTNMRAILTDTNGRLSISANVSASDTMTSSSFPNGVASANASMVGLSGLTNFTTAQPFPACEGIGIANAVGAATTQMVALASNSRVRICSFFASNLNTTPTTVKLVQGTGTNCATGQTDLTSLFNLQTNAAGGADLFAQTFPNAGLMALSGNAVCITSSAAGSVSATITWSRY